MAVPNVIKTATQATVAEFDPAQGPTVEWLRERFLKAASNRLTNDRPVIE